MRCIYLGKDEACYANPPVPILVGIYKPENEIQTHYCKSEEFPDCPRLRATLDHLKATSGVFD